MNTPSPPPGPRRPHRPPRARARGVTLVEALIAFLVVSFGMLALLRTQDTLRLNSESSRHRGEALRLAQLALEDQRAFAALRPQAGVHDYAAIQSANHGAGNGFQTNTAYQVRSQVAADPHRAIKRSDMEVAWTDRQGQAQALQLHALVAGQDPALAAALGQPPRAHPAWGAHGRSPFIPPQAKDLGNGRSAFKPLGQGTVAWVFDNTSGRITATCTGVSSGLWQGQLTIGHLTQCTAVDGLLLSGLVRFSLANPPLPEAANDGPLPLSVTLQLSGQQATAMPAPLCLSGPVEEVQLTLPSGGTVTEWVPLGATPTSLGMPPWSTTGERFASYQCLVDTAGGGITAWSGRSDVVPSGWAIGLNPGQYRVCRYSSDTDASGSVDRNEEHPANYTQVSASLTQQHFLVVRGELACPVRPPIKVDGVGAQVYVDWSTAQHQP